jgi:gamma-glutamyl-gamma-aminobutyrate hydrolase PuuD
MSDKPVVGLNLICRCDRFMCSGFAEPVLQRWVEFLETADAVPLVVPAVEHAAAVMRQLDRVDAFLYTGWRDLDPESDAHGPEAVDHNPETLLMRTIAERQVPFLGFGRGIQLLNVALGGSLHPVLVDDRPGHRHLYPHNPRHTLMTTSGSLLDKVYTDPETLVPSIHEAAVDDVAVGFAITARGPGGVVEAIECESDEWFAVGVQFHPDPYTAGLDLRLLDAFLSEVHTRTPQPVCG